MASLQPIAGEGWTFAHFDRVRYGSGNSASAWFADRTPTLLAPNDGGGIFVGAYGCPQLTYASLVGAEFLQQGAVQYPSANPAQLLVTRVVHVFVGSR